MRQPVDALGDQALAGSGFAEQHHGRVGCGNLMDQPSNALHGVGTPHDVGQHRVGLTVMGMDPVVVDQHPPAMAMAFEHAVDGGDEALRVDGLGEEVVRAALHGLDDGVDVGVRRDHHHREHLVGGQVGNQIQAAGVRKLQIEQDEFRFVALEIGPHARSRGRGMGHVPGVAEHPGQDLGLERVILDDEDRGGLLWRRVVHVTIIPGLS
jgi:hypothetical protein